MNKRIHFTTSAFVLLLVGAAAFVLSRQPVVVRASVAEQGGFSPSALKAKVGEPLRLRLLSEDVEHRFAVGLYPMPPMSFSPGKPAEVILTFQTPGRYTYYDAAPSSPGYWRMRGVIEVSGNEPAPTAAPPLYVQLGYSLDEEEHEGEPHEEEGEMEIPWQQTPSAARGEAFRQLIPPSAFTREYYVTHSPMEAYEDLRADPTLTSQSDQAIWDAVALLWASQTTPSLLTDGKELYTANCSACHGTEGASDGEFADEMQAQSEASNAEHHIEVPTNFTQPHHLLEAKPAIVHGMILRGGMGTGMPMWGDILTDQELWSQVSVLYSFLFQFSK
jgi:mono/diheme cytochrome c family protein